MTLPAMIIIIGYNYNDNYHYMGAQSSAALRNNDAGDGKSGWRAGR
jgi:hypothetical protein